MRLAEVVRAAGSSCRCLGTGCRRCRRRTERALKRELKRGHAGAAQAVGARIAAPGGRFYEVEVDGSLRRVDPAQQGGVA